MNPHSGYPCVNCRGPVYNHTNGQCLFAPTKLLIKPRIESCAYGDELVYGYDHTTAEIFCYACLKYSYEEAVGQLLTQCPLCKVSFVPFKVWDGTL